MSLLLYAHPFSSYCQKVLIALYENKTPFEYRMLQDAESMAELASLWLPEVSGSDRWRQTRDRVFDHHRASDVEPSWPDEADS
jgi:hypothetical protein